MSSTIRTLMRSATAGRLLGSLRLLRNVGVDRLDEERREDSVLVEQGLQDDAVRRRGLSGVCRIPQDEIDRARRSGEEDRLGLRIGDAEDDQLRRAAERRTRGRRAGASRRGRSPGTWRVDRAEDLEVLEQDRSLDGDRPQAVIVAV